MAFSELLEVTHPVISEWIRHLKTNPVLNGACLKISNFLLKIEYLYKKRILMDFSISVFVFAHYFRSIYIKTKFNVKNVFFSSIQQI
jgi:hypothetical protein